MDDIAVFVPCYNEELTIGKVICDIRENLPKAHIYVCDNNSTDSTALIAKSLKVTVIREPLQGKGNVVKSIFRNFDARCYILVDGDDTHALDHISEMATLILNDKADMVVGDRLSSSSYYKVNQRKYHNFGNKLMLSISNKLFGVDFKDLLSGYRAFNYRFAKTFGLLSGGFEIETEMSIMAASQGIRIASLPVLYKNRPEGSHSKLRTFYDGMKIFKTILDLHSFYKPYSFFMFLSLILGTLSCICYSLSLFGVFAGSLKLLGLILGSFLGLGSILSIFTGVIVHHVKNSYLRLVELSDKSLKPPLDFDSSSIKKESGLSHSSSPGLLFPKFDYQDTYDDDTEQMLKSI